MEKEVLKAFEKTTFNQGLSERLESTKSYLLEN
ncbi:hypothetical protein EDC14_104040 [Hydrogenispora ethanolica]|uniref:Uncharacterized protein n=1 Tax=Hydrogenispora ethanolica TaxID=1082276 RepID=A0A4R1R0M2_HYDET|nr:hypothetical protein EDC14_104040 [Hydrogenispora ethanolica]